MSTTDRTPNPVRRRRAFIAAGFVVPALAAFAAIVVQVIALPNLPAEIAVHWNASGDADRWAAPWTMILVTALTGALAIGFAAASYAPLRDGTPGGTFRWVGTTTAALATFLAALFGGIVWTQRGGGTPSSMTLVGASLAVAVIVGTIAWFAQPTDPEPEPGNRVAPLEITSGQRTLWLHTEVVSRVILGLAAFVVGLAVLTAALGWAGDASTGSVIGSLTIILIAVAAIVTTFAFHLRVDDAGLTVRAIAGLPRWRIPVEEITDVQVIHVRAIGDFGGYGVRWRPGKIGVILKSGPSLAVTRRSGRTFVVTLDDPATPAALLGALALRDAT
ncbi:DUF1648 domain-containing protein [Gordonia zhaorongruii]|uniref:DUF1648 domain-containing protein n=1 Tax=Gordonia zhaorongruii TaxID=2597659 RepID=UPI001643696A|nr:DUF1648 domain-containing protein [Gordonia zhaorongruii]